MPQDKPQSAASRLIAPNVLDGLACTASLTLLLVSSSLCGQGVTMPARAFGLPTHAAAGTMALCYAALAVVAYTRPRALLERRTNVIAILAGCASILALWAGHASSRPVVFVCGMLLNALVSTWAMFLFACQISSLSSVRVAAATVTGGVVARQLLLPLCRMVHGLVPALPISTAMVLACASCLRKSRHVQALARADDTSLAQLEVINPLSSLRPPALLFLGIFAISLTYHFASSFGMPGLGAQRTAMVLLMFALLYALLVQREGQEDRLFSLCVLFLMAGLLLTSLFVGDRTFVSHTLVYLGFTCFSILVWLLVYGIGKRNPIAAMPIFCAIECVDSLGHLAGSCISDLCASFAEAIPYGMQGVVVGLALCFFAFVWLGFQKFSFTNAIRGIETMQPDRIGGSGIRTEHAAAQEHDVTTDTDGAHAEDAPVSSGAHRSARCALLAAEAGLTPREAEVFEILARGRNARYIVDSLGVTRNTAKAHISHIYLKLGVHSHQELLSLVEADNGEPESTPGNGKDLR